MLKSIVSGLRMFIVLTVIIGVLYPLFVTVAAQVLYPSQANGSLVEKDGVVIGSTLIGQAIDDPLYFSSRPSAVSYMLGSSTSALGSSGASNLSTVSVKLADIANANAVAFREANGLAVDAVVPLEMIFASGSGLDPHISPEAARLQIDRVATTRGLDRQVVADLVEKFVESPTFSILGQARVNVLSLNLALDELQ
ncbi:MAG: potassium-transporting ATPase subunit KdpC [bacterium]|nr:potassium-transporting ATPase subunit KdpC [bacterium]